MGDSPKKFNVGVVGYGLSAKIFHIPFINSTPSLELYSIVQRSPNPTDSAPSDYPNLKHHTSFDSFLADSALDVVVLSTPPPSHFPMAQAALQAGKHVFVEKPFVPTSAEADQLIKLAKDKGRLICVYQNRRWDGDFLTVRKLVADGTLGRIVEFETHFDRLRAEKPTTWKGALTMDQGNGAIFDLGTHLIDQVYVLFGLPKTVFAKFVNQRDGFFTGKQNKIDDEPDSITVQLFYEDGLIVFVRIGVLSVEAKQLRYWVRGSKGSYRKFNLDPQEGQLKAGISVDDAKFGRDDPEWHGTLCTVNGAGEVKEKSFPNTEPGAYATIYQLFARALASGKEEDIPVPASQARDVLKIIEAARTSADKGAEVALA